MKKTGKNTSLGVLLLVVFSFPPCSGLLNKVSVGL